MKTTEQSAFSDQQSAPSLNAFFDDQADATPVRADSSYDFFGNSELLITQS